MDTNRKALQTSNYSHAKVLQVLRDYIGSSQQTALIDHLMEAGAHRGEPKRYRHPKMTPYIYEAKGDSHIISLKYTIAKLIPALQVIYQEVQTGAEVLFVCTNRDLAESVRSDASRCGQYFVTNRWLGGLLTNWHTSRGTITFLHNQRKTLVEHDQDLSKKQKLDIQRSIDKIMHFREGVEKLDTQPRLVILSSIAREKIAANEVRRLQQLGKKIISIGIADTNADPDLVDLAIPANDDSGRTIEFFYGLISNVVIAALRDKVRTQSKSTDTEAAAA